MIVAINSQTYILQVIINHFSSKCSKFRKVLNSFLVNQENTCLRNYVIKVIFNNTILYTIALLSFLNFGNKILFLWVYFFSLWFLSDDPPYYRYSPYNMEKNSRGTPRMSMSSHQMYSDDISNDFIADDQPTRAQR